MSKFVITKRSQRRNASLITPATAAKRGIAFQRASTAGVSELADGTEPFVGFSTREHTVAGPTLGDAVYPGRTDLPVKCGLEGSFEHAEEYIAEGSDYLYSGGGNTVQSSTALKTKCSFKDGKTCVATTGQYAEYMLVEKLDPEETGNLRYKFQKIEGVVV